MCKVAGIALIVLLVGGVPRLVPVQVALDRGPDENTQTVVTGIDVPAFPGAPFSGTGTIVRTRP